MENIEIALSAIQNLTVTIRYFGRKAWHQVSNYGDQKKGAFLRSYYAGAILGLSASISRIRKEREESAKAHEGNLSVDGQYLPMVILNQVEKRAMDDVNDFLEKNIPYKTKQHKSKPTTAGLMMGFEKGKTLSPQGSLGTPAIKGNLSN